MEPASIVVLVAIYLGVARSPRATNRPYLLYQVVPLLMGLGFAAFLAGAPAFAACALASLGYVLFEVLALNDHCTIVLVGYGVAGFRRAATRRAYCGCAAR